MPNSNCKAISKATKLSKATEAAWCKEWFTNGAYSNMLRPEMQNQFSACFVTLFCRVNFLSVLPVVLLGSNRKIGRAVRSSRTCYFVVFAQEPQARKGTCLCKVSCYITVALSSVY